MSDGKRKASPDKARSLPMVILHGVSSWPLTLILFAVMSIFLGVLIEWAGIFLFDWWDEDHALEMLQLEVEYLNQFPQTAWGVSASNVGVYFSDLVISTGLLNFPASVANAGNTIIILVSSAVNIILLFAIRVAIVICALPAFFIIGIVALVDGLTERDIRRYCGGVESSFIYHYAKPWIFPVMLISAALYVSLPWSINPAIWFAPALAFTGLAVYITASKFKKYA